MRERGRDIDAEIENKERIREAYKESKINYEY